MKIRRKSRCAYCDWTPPFLTEEQPGPTDNEDKGSQR
jgi:hypothetical protein